LFFTLPGKETAIFNDYLVEMELATFEDSQVQIFII
jgi:hypothetical protein